MIHSPSVLSVGGKIGKERIDATEVCCNHHLAGQPGFRGVNAVKERPEVVLMNAGNWHEPAIIHAEAELMRTCGSCNVVHEINLALVIIGLAAEKQGSRASEANIEERTFRRCRGGPYRLCRWRQG